MSSLRRIVRAVGACAVLYSGAATGTDGAPDGPSAAFLRPTVNFLLH